MKNSRIPRVVSGEGKAMHRAGGSSVPAADAMFMKALMPGRIQALK